MIYEPINGNLLKINNKNINTLIEYNIERNKLWKDSERSMAGTMKAKLIGIFPKLILKFRPMNQLEMQNLTLELDKAFFRVEYYDNRSKKVEIGRYYASDYTVKLKDKRRGLYDELSVSLIPLERKKYV